jgi:Icc-related predicted phosphoesterase
LFIEFLLRKFDEPFDGKTVVVSHHSPGNALRRRGRHGDRVEAAYWANLEHMIGHHNKANLWLHGHVHQNWDYIINETRVVCNPFGYYENGENGGFDKDLIIEI